MATDSNTLLDEAKCLGCASNSSISDLLKLGILGRIASAYSAVQSFIARAGITDPSQITAVSALAESAVAHGWWGKCDLIYPFVGGSANAHAQNLKSSSFTITWNGTVTHDANGITGNGIDGYGNTDYLPATSGQIQLASSHLSLYLRTLSPNTTRYYCGSGFTPRTAMQHGSTATTLRFYGNDTGAADQGPISLGYSMGSRFISSERHIFNAGVDLLRVQTATGVAVTSFFILALNNSGVAASFTAANIAGLTVGGGISFSEYQQMETDWQTFQTALGRQV